MNKDDRTTKGRRSKRTDNQDPELSSGGAFDLAQLATDLSDGIPDQVTQHSRKPRSAEARAMDLGARNILREMSATEMLMSGATSVTSMLDNEFAARRTLLSAELERYAQPADLAATQLAELQRDYGAIAEQFKASALPPENLLNQIGRVDLDRFAAINEQLKESMNPLVMQLAEFQRDYGATIAEQLKPVALLAENLFSQIDQSQLDRFALIGDQLKEPVNLLATQLAEYQQTYGAILAKEMQAFAVPIDNLSVALERYQPQLAETVATLLDKYAEPVNHIVGELAEFHKNFAATAAEDLKIWARPASHFSREIAGLAETYRRAADTLASEQFAGLFERMHEFDLGLTAVPEQSVLQGITERLWTAGFANQTVARDLAAALGMADVAKRQGMNLDGVSALYQAAAISMDFEAAAAESDEAAEPAFVEAITRLYALWHQLTATVKEGGLWAHKYATEIGIAVAVISLAYTIYSSRVSDAETAAREAKREAGENRIIEKMELTSRLLAADQEAIVDVLRQLKEQPHHEQAAIFVVVKAANVRDAPINGRIIDRLSAQEAVEIIERRDRWVRVRYVSYLTEREWEGWIRRDLLRKTPSRGPTAER